MSTSGPWQIKRIGDLATVARGSSPRPIADQRYFEGGEIPWIKIADATKAGKYLYETKEHVNEFGASFSRRLPIGSLIVAASGTLGYTQMLGVSGCVHDGWLYLTDFKGVDKQYLYYFFQWKKEHFYNSAYGAAIQNINTEILRETEIALPPLSVQERVASILSAYDDLIENNTRRIRILEQMAQTLYREWFVNFRFPDHQKVKMVESELGPIPEGWRVRKLSTMVETQYGYTESATTHPVGPKYLRGMDINKFSYIQWDKVPYCPISGSDHAAYRLKVGDIVVIRMADPGKVGIVEKDIDAVFASYLIRLKICDSSLPPYYLFSFLLSDSYQDYVTGASTGTTRKSASAGVITDVPMLVPDSATSERYELQIRDIRQMLNNLVDRNSILCTTRDFLLPKLISGEIPVDAAAELVEQTA